MSDKLKVAFLLIFGIVMISRPVSAHHGVGAIYDTNRPITLKGVVTEFVWSNPHVQIYFDVKDEQGNVVHWSCETLSPGKLTRSGWNKNVLKPGDQITVTVSPSKVGKPIGSLRKLLLSDGKELGFDEMPQY